MKLFRTKKRTRIDRILDRDQSVLIEIYQHLVSDVKKFVQNFSGDLEDVEDILLESLVLMWEKVHQKKLLLETETYSFTRESFKYLWSKKVNNSIALSEVDAVVVKLIESDESLLLPAYYNDKYKMISDAFHSLSKISQKILSHVYWEHMNYEKLSFILKTSNAHFAKEKKESSFSALMDKVN